MENLLTDEEFEKLHKSMVNEGVNMSRTEGWIGVDLDGTLATYTTFKGHEHIGEPIAPMVERVKRWIAEGRDVRVFTARADGGVAAKNAGEPAYKEFEDRDKIINIIQDWTEKHIGVRLPVTNVKDFCMDELWDDRAVQVEKNTGRRLGYSPRGLD